MRRHVRARLLEHDLVVGEVVFTELRTKLRTKLKLPKKTIDEIEVRLRDGLRDRSGDQTSAAAAATVGPDFRGST